MNGSGIAQLVLAAQRADRQAAEVLWARGARLAYARALRLTGDADRAWDIAQDALLSAVRELPRLREPGAFLGWLKAIVDHSAFAHHAKLSKRREEPLSAASRLPAPAPGPAEAAEHRTLAAQARRAMEGLPARERLIVELFYFEEMSCREVADFLKTTPASVKMALHRSRMRMRREMRTMAASTAKKTGKPPIVRTMSGGDSRAARHDLLFEHDSRTARFYMELYPVGDAQGAARTLGMGDKDRDSELAWLQARKLIAPEGDRWRCTMPVMNEKDLEIIRPWAQEVTAPVTAALDDLYGQLSVIAEQADPASARDTAIAAGLYAEAARRPFRLIAEAMRTSDVDRGDFGKRSVAAVSAQEGWPKGYSGGMNTGEWTSDQFPEVRRHYFLRPLGTDRSDLARFARSVGEEMEVMEPVAGRGVTGFLCSLNYDPISAESVGDRAVEFGLQVGDVGTFLADLEQLHAVTRHNGSIELSVPVVPYAMWQPFLRDLDRIGGRIVGAVSNAADDLRGRMVRCSFTDCNFSDSVELCMTLAGDLVGEVIGKRGWVTFPGKADFSWGLMFVC